MIEVIGDLWSFQAKGEWVVITTNGIVNGRGLAVMGRGVAREAAMKFSMLPRLLAERLQSSGNHVYAFVPFRLITLPVKDHWADRADPGLIMDSLRELKVVVRALGLSKIYMVRPGCGNGQLNWNDVKPLLAHLPDDYFVVEKGTDDVLHEHS